MPEKEGLETIKEIKGRYKADHITDILTANPTAAIKSYNHENLEHYGVGKDKEKKYWNAVIRQTLISKFVSKDIENYGQLNMTEKGEDFLKKPISFMITKDHKYDEDDQDTKSTGGTSAVDPQLMAMLKDLRKEISRKKDIPPFVIFQDPSLEDMAIQYPITLDELHNIVGVGSGKASRYGKEFIELIQKYVEENEIERPQDFVVKSVVNKSGNKVLFIQNIDRKLSLEDIAKSKGLSMLELIDELEAIVYSGTKLNIDYYIDEILDQEAQDDLYDYFNEAETDSMKEALEELDEYYTEEEIRLVRLKFISELGN